MTTRRQFLEQASAALAVSGLCQVGNAQPGAAIPTPQVLPAALPSDSPLGSLYPFIKATADKRTFPYSFLQNGFQKLDEWKSLARAKVQELLCYSPEKVDPQAQIVRSIERDGYVQHELSFLTAADVRVPASLLLPKGRTAPLPAIIALHDHGAFYLWGREKLLENDAEHPALTEFRDRHYGGKAIAAELARQGYVVLVIDMFYWGERRMLLDDDPADWRERYVTMPVKRVHEFHSRASLMEQFAARGLMVAGITWPGIMLWDDRGSVDYLLSRPEVDPQRIGCVGLSVGGLRSMYLAALDDRIRASVVVGWMASFPAQLKSHLKNSIGYSKLIPGVSNWLDYPDIAALAMPTPLLAINGRQDGLFEPNGVQHCFDKLTACYQKAGCAGHFRGSWYDSPHEFNLQMQSEAWAWLKRWLA